MLLVRLIPAWALTAVQRTRKVNHKGKQLCRCPCVARRTHLWV